MGAPDLLRQLESAGLSLTATGGNLVVRPREAITAELRSLIRVNKPALLSALTAPEKRRQRVLSMLDVNPDLTYALITDANIDPDHVILTLAIRAKGTLELSVHKERYDAVLLYDLIRRHCGTVH